MNIEKEYKKVKDRKGNPYVIFKEKKKENSLCVKCKEHERKDASRFCTQCVNNYRMEEVQEERLSDKIKNQQKN